MTATKSGNDAEILRLQVVRDLDLLDTPGEARFDRITRMAREILQVPISTIELVDASRVWVKSSQGLAESEAPRLDSFADAVIRQNGSLLVGDARYDDRFRSHPWVSGNGGVRFYAGHPIRVRGEIVGTLSVMGPHPRRLSVVQAQVLEDLAALAERELLIRRWSGGQESLLASRPAAERRDLLDPATGLWNRKGGEDLLRREIERTVRAGSGLGVMIVALEASRPSKVLLRETSERLRGALRPCDLVARWEEGSFLVLLPGWDAGTAERVAQHLAEAAAPEGEGRASARGPFLRIGVTAAETGRELDPSALLALAAGALEDTRAPGSRGIRVRRSRQETAIFAGLELAELCAMPGAA